MKVDVYMPLYLGDYAKDTGDLTTEEHGAYLLIMMAMWAAGGSIPSARMAAFSKVPARRWPAVWATIQRFFLVTGEMASQGRLLREMEAAERRRTVATNNGTRGGRPKGELPHTDDNRPVISGLASGSVPVNRNETSSPSPSDPDRKEEIRSAPSAPRVYASEFELFWENCHSPRRKGDKVDAEEAWKKAGRPAADVLLKLWSDYLASLGDTLPKDVCRWLQKGRWQGPYDPAPAAPDTRPQWAREREERAAREKIASADYFERQKERPAMCGYHLYNGEDKRFVLEECPTKCPRHGEQEQAVAHA